MLLLAPAIHLTLNIQHIVSSYDITWSPCTKVHSKHLRLTCALSRADRRSVSSITVTRGYTRTSSKHLRLSCDLSRVDRRSLMRQDDFSSTDSLYFASLIDRLKRRLQNTARQLSLSSFFRRITE